MRGLLLGTVALIIAAGPAHAGPVAGLFAAGQAAFSAITASQIGMTVLRIGVTVAATLLGQARANQRQTIEVPGVGKGSQGPQTLIAGKCLVAGHLGYRNSRDKDEYLVELLEICDIAVADYGNTIINGEYSDLEGPRPLPSEMTKGQADRNKWEGKNPDAYVRFNYGTENYADPYLVNYFASKDSPWTADCRLPYVANVVMTYRGDHRTWSGQPETKVEAFGRCYDPRRDSTMGGNGPQRWGDHRTWEFNENPVCWIYHLMRGVKLPDNTVYGGGSNADDLPLDVWIAEMNHCDQMVGPAGKRRKRYRCSLEISMTEPAANWIEQLLQSCNGTVAEVGGTWYIRCGPPRAPVAHITDGDIIVTDEMEFSPFDSAESVINGVIVSYRSPRNMWKVIELDAIRDEEAITRDGKEKFAELRLAAVSDAGQARQLAKAALKDSNRQVRHVLTLPADYVWVNPLDTISYTSRYNGYANEIFEVTGKSIDLQSLASVFSLRARSAVDFIEDDALEAPAPVQNAPRYEVAPLTLDGFDAYPHEQRGKDGNVRTSGVRLVWDADLARRGASVSYQVRLGSEMIVDDSTAAVADGEVIIRDLQPGAVVEARGRLVRRQNEGAWTAWVSVTVPNAKRGIDEIDTAGLRQDIDDAQAAAAAAAAEAAEAKTKADGAQAYTDAAAQSVRDDLAVDYSEAVTAAADALQHAQDALAGAQSADLAATLAGQHRDVASAKATQATQSANQAGDKATAAADSASAAGSSATDAGTSATAAQNARVAAESARTTAQQKATAAADSASVAATEATKAETRASAANSAKVAAETARDTATQKATAAGQSATLASTSASDASTSAAAAQTARVAAEAARNTAGQRATAASDSASLAATHATDAGSSAAASQTARNAAETARAQASTARNDAVTAKQDAETARAGATSSFEMAARIASRGISVLSDTFLAHPGWTATTSSGSLTKRANEQYPLGTTWDFTVGAADETGLQAYSTNTDLWPGQQNADGYVVDVEYTLVSGSISGAGFQLAWTNTAGESNWSSINLAQSQAGDKGATRTARGVLRRPTTFSGSFASHRFIFHANADRSFLTAKAAKRIKLHRINIRVATEEEMGRGEVMAEVQAHLSDNYLTAASTNTAIAQRITNYNASLGPLRVTVSDTATALADLSGGIASLNLIARAGNASAAGISAVSVDQRGDPTYSALQLHGDYVIAHGTMSVSSLVVADTSNLFDDPNLDALSSSKAYVQWDDAANWDYDSYTSSSSLYETDKVLRIKSGGKAETSTGARLVYRPEGVKVRPGTKYHVSCIVGGDGPTSNNSRGIFRVYFYSKASNGSLTYSRSEGMGYNSGDPTRYEMTVKPASHENVMVFAFQAMADGNGRLDRHILFNNPTITPMVGAVLIEDGAVTSEKVLTETLKAWNGRFNSLAAANVRIGNLEVDTFNIANRAVTLPVFAYTNSGPLIQFQSWTDLQSIVVKRELGQDVYLTFGMDCFSNADSGWSHMELRLLRSGTQIEGTLYQLNHHKLEGETRSFFGRKTLEKVDGDRSGGTVTYKVQGKINKNDFPDGGSIGYMPFTNNLSIWALVCKK